MKLNRIFKLLLQSSMWNPTMLLSKIWLSNWLGTAYQLLTLGTNFRRLRYIKDETIPEYIGTSTAFYHTLLIKTSDPHGSHSHFQEPSIKTDFFQMSKRMAPNYWVFLVCPSWKKNKSIFNHNLKMDSNFANSSNWRINIYQRIISLCETMLSVP